MPGIPLLAAAGGEESWSSFLRETAAHPTYALALVLLLGVSAQWLAWRFRLPSILLLLLAGIAIGPIGLNIFTPERLAIGTDVLFAFVSAAVAIILFEGGLSLQMREFLHGGAGLRRLIMLGVPITAIGATLSIRMIMDLSWQISVLAGTLLVVTGPTVIVPLLQLIKPVGRVGGTVKWEGILNDPIGAIMAVVVLETLLTFNSVGNPWMVALFGILKAVVIAGLIGTAVAWMIITLMRRHLLPDHLHGVAVLALVIGSYIVCDHFQHESGLLAVTVTGIIIGNQHRVPIRPLHEFNEHLRTLLIAALFIILAARFSPAQLAVVEWNTIWLLAALVLVVRPIAVVLSTVGTDMPWRERCLVAGLAPRGIVAAAVASLFALRLEGSGIADVHQLEPLVYVIIVGTVLLYGFGGLPLARLLGLNADDGRGVLIIGAHDWARAMAHLLRDHGIHVQLVDSSYDMVRIAQDEDLAARHFSVIDERMEQDIELAGLGAMLALTPNDEANAIAAIRFGSMMGRERVYQLHAEAPSADSGRPTTMPLAAHVSGRTLFDAEVTWRRLQERFARGDRMTVLDDDEAAQWPDVDYQEPLALFMLDTANRITVCESQPEELPTGYRLVILHRMHGESAIVRS